MVSYFGVPSQSGYNPLGAAVSVRDKPLKLQVICPQNETAVLKGFYVEDKVGDIHRRSRNTHARKVTSPVKQYHNLGSRAVSRH